MKIRSTKSARASNRSRTNWARLREATDQSINYSDIPATSPEFWARARLVLPPRKILVSLRIDEDILAAFKSQGGRYQTRMNAVLRAYVDSHASASGVGTSRTSGYKERLLADLEAARERCEALEHLRNAVGPRLFSYVQRRIEAEAEGPHSLKLPVLFFFLVRRDPPALREFDTFLGRVKRSHRKRHLPNLIDRLRSEGDYRRAVSAIFEIDILRTLLDTAPAGSVDLYPKIGMTPNHADASVRLGHKTMYIEVKLLSQDSDQEHIQDIGLESALERAAPSKREMGRLGVYSVREGVVTGVGDPYGDALRIVGKLTEKPNQLHPDAPNVICLGLPDSMPDIRSVEWAVNDVFSGAAKMAHVVLERTNRVGEIETLTRLVRDSKPEPRLTGVLVFEAHGSGITPQKAFTNHAAGPLNRVEAQEWDALLGLFGFPATKAVRSPRAR